ncbi:MAG: peptidyl-prolyl cis-trans isomerase C [Planctomycetota bacterium]
MKHVIVLMLFVLVLLPSCKDEAASVETRASTNSAWDTDAKREWAARLRNEGLDEEALVVYEDLINTGHGLSANSLVGTSVIVAEMHMKKGRYSKALASLLRATQLGAKGELLRKVDTWKIECLERLGKSAAADRLLDRSSALRKTKDGAAITGGATVAKIGEEEIKLAEIETLVAQQSPEMRERFDTKAGRLELLKSLVAQRVFERKARKLGLQDDVKVQFAIDLATRDILVRKLMADEVRGKFEVSDEDAKLYFEANRERFREPNQMYVAQIIVDGLEQEKQVREALTKDSWETVCAKHSKDGKTRENGGVIEGVVVEGQSHKIISDVRGLVTAVGTTLDGEISPQAMKTSAGRHIVKVLKRQDGKPLPFDKVKEAASRLLKTEREQAAVSGMMADALKQSDVQIFEDQLGK